MRTSPCWYSNDTHFWGGALALWRKGDTTGWSPLVSTQHTLMLRISWALDILV